MLYSLVDIESSEDMEKKRNQTLTGQVETSGMDDQVSPLMKFLRSEFHSAIHIKLAIKLVITHRITEKV